MQNKCSNLSVLFLYIVIYYGFREILCKSKEKDVVDYVLSRNMSSTKVVEYRTKLRSKEILQKVRKIDKD